ncbi:MAG: type III pantothenate kinase [Planctomycetota bacterium]
MHAAFLSVDLGNSRCKACLSPAQGSTPTTWAADCGPAMAHELAAWLGSLERAGQVALASVADDVMQRAILGVLEDWCGRPVPTNPECGLEFDLRQPHGVGHDRLYAARGALVRTQGRAAVVVDAGTALTVDAVRPGGAGSAGVFLGGAIAPGPELAAEALARGAARLPRIEPRPGQPALGKDTRGALAAGVGVGFEGAAAHLVERVAAEAHMPDAAVVLTGGAADYLVEVLTRPGRELCVEPHLVHLGLRAALGGRPA